jgi:hypothetical protein
MLSAADVSPSDAELVKLRFKNKQLAAQVDALDAQLKKVSADAAEAQALYEDSQTQVRRNSTRNSQLAARFNGSLASAACAALLDSLFVARAVGEHGHEALAVHAEERAAAQGSPSSKPKIGFFFNG